MRLLDKCEIFYSLAAVSAGNPFSQGISRFKKSLQSYLPQIRDLISDKNAALELAQNIRQYLAEKNRTVVPYIPYENVGKYIVMLENYYIYWLNWLKTNAPQKFNANFNPNLLNVMGVMLANLKMVYAGNATNYKPFTLYIDGQTAPVDIDRLITKEYRDNDIK